MRDDPPITSELVVAEFKQPLALVYAAVINNELQQRARMKASIAKLALRYANICTFESKMS